MDTLQMAKQLKGEYKDVFEKADVYASMETKNEIEYKDKMMNLYDCLLEAQNEQKVVTKIIGGDIQKFCKEYFQTEKESINIKNIAKKSALFMVIVIIIELLDIIFFQKNMSIMNMKSNAMPFVCGFMCGLLGVKLVKLIFKPLIFRRKVKPIVFAVATLGIWLGIVGAGFFIFGEKNLEISAFLILLVSGGYLLIYGTVVLISRIATGGENRKEQKVDNSIHKEFADELKRKSKEVTIVNRLVHRYMGMEKKMKKKNHDFSWENFVKKIRKEQNNRWIGRLNGVLFSGLIIGIPVIGEMERGTSIQNILILGTILAVFCITVCYAFAKREDHEIILDVLDECERRNITILEYEKEVKE